MKSDYSKESITEFLSRKYGEDIRLFPIKEGQESQAYWFSRGGREYVVRWKIQCKLPPKTKRFCPLVLK